MDLAAKIGLPLAPLNDPDKVFILNQLGIILGIKLDTKTMKWRIPSDKVHRNRHAFEEVLDSQVIDKIKFQRLLGMTWQVTKMLPVFCFKAAYPPPSQSSPVHKRGPAHSHDPPFATRSS